MTAAEIANADGIRRLGIRRWRKFLKTIDQMPQVYFRRPAVHARLEAWTDEEVRAAWKVARYHGITSYGSNGTHAEPLCREALAALKGTE